MLHDPTGLCEWQRGYHLFYLAPNKRGHAVSDDMVHWQELPMVDALDGGTTGQTITTDDRTLMSFTRDDGIYLASASDPMLLNWERSLVLPKDTLLKDFQSPLDSCIWKEDDQWCLLVRKHRWEQGLWFLRGTRPALERFDSGNLKDWNAKGLFCEKETAIEPGDDLACPNFLPIGGGRHLLIFYCHPRGPMYSLGTYDRENYQNNNRMTFKPAVLHGFQASATIPHTRSCLSILPYSAA